MLLFKVCLYRLMKRGKLQDHENKDFQAFKL